MPDAPHPVRSLLSDIQRRRAHGVDPDEVARVRERVRLIVGICAQTGKFHRGLVQAAARLTPEEAQTVADLEAQGLDVCQMRDLLHGAHVLIDDPELYERWQARARQRVSSHHKDIDKKQYPDYGMKGPLVRERLHGRTRNGTWLQLEKTPATMTAGKLPMPSVNDLKHLLDYVIYRLTRSNVGPWGRSDQTERRPMYLSPDLGVHVPVPDAAVAELTATVSDIEGADNEAADRDGDALERRFPPPQRADDLVELQFTGVGKGRGLFGDASAWTVSARTPAGTATAPPRHDGAWTLPPASGTRTASTPLDDDHTLTYAVRTAS